MSYEDVEEQQRIFWEEEYLKLSIEEKRKVWIKYFHTGMRNQIASGYNRYDIFNKINYAIWKHREPEIDGIMTFSLDFINKNLHLKVDIDRIKSLLF